MEVDELYGLPLEEFVAARTDKKLGKPTRSAWMVNQLMRHRKKEMRELLDVGESLRKGGDLRELSERRRAVLKTLAQETRTLAKELGETLSEPVQQEVAATLEPR